jgi:hypothetical protein
MLRDSLVICTERTPGQWQVFLARGLLGICLAGQKKYTEAEPLLRQGYESLKPHQPSMSEEARAMLPQIVEKLVELYQSSDRPADAEKWKKELRTFNRSKEGD